MTSAVLGFGALATLQDAGGFPIEERVQNKSRRKSFVSIVSYHPDTLLLGQFPSGRSMRPLTAPASIAASAANLAGGVGAWPARVEELINGPCSTKVRPLRLGLLGFCFPVFLAITINDRSVCGGFVSRKLVLRIRPREKFVLKEQQQCEQRGEKQRRISGS